MALLRSVAALAIVMASSSMSACVCSESAHAPASAKAASAGEAPASFEVVPLRYAEATELAGLVGNVVDRGKVRVLADPRTNSLLLAGSSADLAAVKELVAKLDVELPAKQ